MVGDVIELYGNTTGLSPSAIKTLERIYRRRVPGDVLTTPELTRSLVDASKETGRQVGALVHRSGEVDYVIVGDAGKMMLPDIGRLRAAVGRFRGLRLIHTHVRGETLTKDDITDLVRLRLDLVAAIQLSPSGDPRSIMYAHNLVGKNPGDPAYREFGPMPLVDVNVNVGSLMADLESEFAKLTSARKETSKDGRAILVHVFDKHLKFDAARVAELRELARTAGTEVADVIMQTREHMDPKFVLGRGKLDEVVLRAVELDAQTLVFDRNLSPAQAASISKMSDLKVIDRTQLILDIFAQRAESKDGKLQVELAQLKYNMPRLQQKDDSLSRLTGGIGGRGPGETKLEIGKRRAKERVTHLEEQLEVLGKQREQRRKKRTREGVPTVAIVGYTNAGKSTLLNALTGADVFAEDKLFATLETRSRHLRVGWAGYGGREVVLTDTVGFIRDLPKDLFAAFRSTFEEAADADLLVNVVDLSDPARGDHMKTTEVLLEKLELHEIPRLLVFNKSDAVSPEDRANAERQYPMAVVISAHDRDSTRVLIERVASMLDEKWESSATVPVAVEVTEDVDDRRREEPEEETTLDMLLRKAGKRSRKV